MASREIAGVRTLPSPPTHFHTDWIRRTPRCSFESTPDHRFKIARLTHPNQATHGSFCITSSCIDQNACHRSLRIRRNEQPLPKCSGAVPALEREAVHQQVSNGVQKHKPRNDRLNWLAPISLQDSIPGVEAADSFYNLGRLLPSADQSFVKLKEEPFSINQISRQPRLCGLIAS
jgi:hypothetical protein